VPSDIKSYPPTWEGDLLLACRKCQKKLTDEPGMRALAKLKKTIKRHNKTHPAPPLRVMNVPCMDLCPKGAVTICLPAAKQAMLFVLRSERQIDELYRGQ